MSTKDRFGCCTQPHANNSLWDGPGFSRRQFFRVAGTALTGYYFTQVTRPLDVKAAGQGRDQRDGAELHIHLSHRRSQPYRYLRLEGRLVDACGLQPDKLR